jgi:8-amino-7-oxononanoate synthase
MVELQNTPGRTCMMNGEEFLFFSGYSYLGMNHVNEFTDLVKEGIDKYGLLFPSSRISNTRLKLYEEFENCLSELNGMEDTVSFSSGFLAGQTIASLLSAHKDIYSAPGTHPAIRSKIINEEGKLTFTDWSLTISDFINSSEENEFVIACDSINILTSAIHDFSFLKNISAAKKVIVLIDDSHGIGIIGNNGAGINSLLPKENNIEYITSYSLSKAFNLHGGGVSCSKYWGEKLRHHPNYTASTSIAPFFIHTYLHSKNLYALQREKLFRNIAYLKTQHTSTGILKNDFDLPVFICDKTNAEEHFYNNKVIISSFNYPYPTSDKINRIIISALHTTQDIDKLTSII